MTSEIYNSSVIDEWGWDIPDANNSSSDLVQINEKIESASRNLEASTISPSSDVSGSAAVGAEVDAETIAQVRLFEFGYEVEWYYSYDIAHCCSWQDYRNATVDSIGTTSVEPNIQHTNLSLENIDTNDTKSESVFTSSAEATIDYNGWPADNTVSPYIKLGGDGTGDGRVLEKDNGR